MANPGYVTFRGLKNLWFNIGSRCNLACTHCYVGSNPTNDSLEQLRLEDVKEVFKEPKTNEVTMVYLTGGEPFINRDILDIIDYCLQKCDVTVLTNGTMIKHRITDLVKLDEASNHNLLFRISFDSFNAEEHDAIRGKGMFSKTVHAVKELSSAGFRPIITSTVTQLGEETVDVQAVTNAYRQLFDGFEVEVKILPFTIEEGSNLSRTNKRSSKIFITEDCMKLPGIKEEHFQCHDSRSIVKQDGKLVTYPCPIIYNKKQFAKNSLGESFGKTYLRDHSCFHFCYKAGGKCGN